MPLRALLLLPSGEQPTTSKPKPKPKATKPAGLTIPKSTTFKDAFTSPFKSTFSPLPSPTPSSTFAVGGPSATATGEDNEDDDDLAYLQKDLGWPFDSDTSKQLPSPPTQSPSSTALTLDKERERDNSNRGSNQTYQTALTLPSTSGSSRSGTGTDISTPPESPSTLPILNLGKAGMGTSPLMLGKKPKPLNLPVRRDTRGRPVLKLNTKMPRIGSALHYHTEPRAAPMEEESDEEEYEDDNLNGERTAREAVDQRLHHLMVTTSSTATPTNNLLPPPSPSASRSPSPTRTGFPSTSPASSRPSSRVLAVLGEKIRRSTTNTTLKLTIHEDQDFDQKRTSQHHPPKRKPTRKATRGKSRPKQQRYLDVNPPLPPTRGLPPFKILSDDDLLNLVDLELLLEGRKISFGRVKKNLSNVVRTSHSNTVRGRYIRQTTLPPPPPTLKLEDDPSSSTPVFLRKDGTRIKGLIPMVQIDDENDGGVHREEEREILTVYMSDLVAAQVKEPVACWMYPPLFPSASRNVLALTIHEPHPKAYQYPLPHLNRHQQASLHKLGLLVYAVPRGYEGPVPPVIDLEDEVVAPWVSKPSRINSRDSMMSSSTRSGYRDSTSTLGDTTMVMSPTNNAGVLSPLRNGFGFNGPTSPLRLRFGGDRSNTNPSLASNSGSSGAALGVPDHGAPSSRWGVDGLWSKRSSAASSPRRSLEVSSVIEEEVETDKQAEEDPNATSSTAGRWGTTFGSLRTRAQEYYAARSTAAASTKSESSPVGSPALSTHSALPDVSEEGGTTRPLQLKNTAPLALPTSSQSSAGMTTSRSLGSFFSRATSAVSSTSIARSTSASTLTTTTTGIPADELSALEALREEGIVVKNLDGDDAEAVFDYNTLRDDKKTTATGDAAPAQAAPSRWGWKNRWGGS